MKKLLFTLLLVGFISLTFNMSLNADGRFGDDPKFQSYKINKDILDKDYKLALKEHQVRTGKIIDFYIDFQLGFGGTSANIDQKSNTGAFDTKSKVGFTTGALVYFNLFESVNFATGLAYVGKNFEVAPPVDTASSIAGLDTLVSDISNNYLNIPLYFNFGGMITEDIGVTFNGGPYLGILLSTDDKPGLGYKNFDFGLAGTLTGNYLLNPFISIILGTRFEYGGLNNLGNTQFVDKITTTNYSIFTGIRVGIGM